MKKLILIILGLIFITSCKETKESNMTENKPQAPFVWEGANLYFLMTDRFNNGDPSNDKNFERTNDAAKLRGFEGGDIEGMKARDFHMGFMGIGPKIGLHWILILGLKKI